MSNLGEPTGTSINDPEDRSSFRSGASPSYGALLSIIESAADAIAVEGTDGNVRLWNAAAERIFGRGALEVLGRPFADLLHGSHMAEFALARSRALSGESVEPVELRFARANGEFLKASVSLSRFSDPEAAAEGLFYIIRETPTLSPSDSRLSFIADSLPVLISYVDKDLKYRYANKGYLAWIEKTPEEIVGMPFKSVMGEREFAKVLPHIRRALAGERFAVESKLPYDADSRNMRAEYVPDVDAETGTVNGFFTLVEDISTQKALEEQVRLQLDELENIYRTAPIGLALVDREFRYQRINEWLAEINGVSAADHIGHTFREVVPDLAEHAEQVVRQVIDTGQPVMNAEFAGETKAEPGVGRIWKASWYPYKNRLGETEAVGFVVEDVTEQKKAEANQSFLFRIAELIRRSESAETVIEEAVQSLGRHLDVSRAVFLEIDDEARAFIHRDYHLAQQPSIAGPIPLGQFSPGSIDILKSGRTLVNSDTRTNPRTADFYETGYLPLAMNAFVGAPLMHEGRWVAGLAVIQDRPRQWSDSEVGLIEAVAERVWLAVERLRSERALRESEERLRLATAGAGVGTWRADMIAGRGTWSAEAVALIGAERSEFTSEDWTEPIHPDDRENALRQWARAVDEDIFYEVEFRSAKPAPDGGERWLLSRGSVGRDEEGRPVAAAGVLLDVTERRRAQQELAALRNRELAYLDNLPVGVWFAGPEGQIEFANPAAEAIWQGARYVGIEGLNEYKGRWHATGEIIEPSEWALVRAVRNGETSLNEEIDIECFDGSQKTILNSAVPVRGRDGEITGAVILNQDITEQKRAEYELRQSEAFTRRVLDNLFAFVGVLRPDGTLIEVNRGPLEIGGVTAEDVLGKKFWDCYWWSFSDESRERLRGWIAVAREGEIIRKDVQVRVAGGGLMWIDFQLAPLRDDKGNVTHLIPSGMDITGRREAAEALQTGEERFRLALSHGALYVYEQDLDLRYRWVYPKPGSGRDIIGKTDAELDPTAAGQALEQIKRKVIETGKGVRKEVASHAPGHSFWFDLTAEPHRDAEGNIIGVTGTALNITDMKLAEAEVRQYREFLSLAMQSSRMGAWTRDMTTGGVWWSKELEEIFGLSEGAFSSTEEAFFDFIHDEDRPAVAKAVEKAISGRHAYAVEFRFRHADGTTRWMEGRGEAHYSETGEPIRLFGIGLDITDRKRAEAELLKGAELADVAQEAARAGLYEFEPAAGRTIRNQSLETILGYKAEEFGQTRDAWFGIVHPDDHAAARDSINEGIRTGDGYSIEYRVRHREGHYLWVYDRARVIRGDDGSFERVVGMFVDISDRKQAEEQVRYQFDLVKTITDNTPSCLLMMDAKGYGTFANPAAEAVTGFTADELIGRVLHDVIHHTHPDGTPFPREHCPLDNALPLQEAVVGYEDVFVHKDGHFYPVRCNARPILRAGVAVGTVIEVRDITEEQRIEHERRQILEREQAARLEAESANRSKDEFLAVLSHELRTPLHSMKGWLSMIRSGMLEGEKVEKALEVVARNVESQNELIDDLLDVSRIVSGKLKIEKQRTSLLSLVSGAVSELRPTAQERSLTLDLGMDESADIMNGDPVRLRQVVTNIIQNAVKFTPPGGAISVNLERAGGRARLTVTDTGEGISPEVLPRIFNRFEQSDSSSRRRHGGLGLGLAIAYHLVQMHEGTISAESEGLGKGTSVVVELPLLEASELSTVSDRTDALPRPGGRSLEGVKILIVEDDPDSLELLRIFLSRNGSLVTPAPTAEEGLDRLRRETFDLLITDIGMADMDGYDLLRTVRGELGLSPEQLPAVALSGFASQNDKEAAAAAGFQLHISKPIEIATIAAVVRSVLDNSKKGDR